ncbi:hypothetical protein JCM33374_g2646 [Metschnikowia sp. JCM 33374]|nr:hypothetical protein JCM33374_g2646 [Metschnikowia sp. JCM 33374]
MPEKLYISYNIVHKLCQKAAEEIKASGTKIDLIIAIGGGGFIPARILRSFLKDGKKNIPIQAVGLSLYEQMGNASEETIGKEVVRTQWIDFGNLSQHLTRLLAKTSLLWTRWTTRGPRSTMPSANCRGTWRRWKRSLRDGETTNLSVFVLHNKKKAKRADLPRDLLDSGRYFVGEHVDDVWIAYPWDAQDIDFHTEEAKKQGNY